MSHKSSYKDCACFGYYLECIKTTSMIKGEWQSTLYRYSTIWAIKSRLMKIKYNHIVWHNDICNNIIKINETVVPHYVTHTVPLSLQTRFPKSGPTHKRQVLCLIHGTKHHKDRNLQSLELPLEHSSIESKHDIKESEGNMFNPIFKANVQPGAETFKEVRICRTRTT